MPWYQLTLDLDSWSRTILVLWENMTGIHGMYFQSLVLELLVVDYSENLGDFFWKMKIKNKK